jgi:hypothetical protein
MITALQRDDVEASNLRKRQGFLAVFPLAAAETPLSSQHDSAADTG